MAQILYPDYISGLKLFHIAEEVRTAKTAVNRYYAVCVYTADRI